MKYTFPTITGIDDVERHRASGLIHDAFKRGERRNGTVVYDYSYMDNHVFPPIAASPFAAVARELRGLTFDAASGRLLSRPFHKFFNAGEREEVLLPALPSAESHVVLDKLDGSMVHAFLAPDGTIAFATRWGVTPIARAALDWYAGRDASGAGRAALRRLIEGGDTPIFEWTSPDNVVVVLHAEPALTLTAVRHRESGAYRGFAELAAEAAALGVPLVGARGPLGDWAGFVARVSGEVAGEGCVVRFADGHMLKVKTATYTRVHKFKAHLSQDKDAAEVVVAGTLDDMLPFLTAAERARLEDYRHALLSRVAAVAGEVEGAVARARGAITDGDPRERQKRFWTEHAGPLGVPWSNFATEVWAGKSAALAAVAAGVLKNTGANARFDAIAKALDLPRLGFRFEGDG